LIIALASLSLLVFVYFAFRHSLLAYMRTRIFELRDEAFDIFRKNGIPYDHKAHALFRRTCNGFIYFAPVMEPIPAFFLRLCLPKISRTRDVSERMRVASTGLPEPVAARLQKLHEKLERRIWLYMSLGSITGILFYFLPDKLLVLFRRKVPQTRRSTSKGKYLPHDRKLPGSLFRSLEDNAEIAGGCTPLLAT